MNTITLNATETTGILGSLFAFLAVFFLLFFIIFIILYVLGGLGLMNIAKKNNEEYSWLAWIPFANVYLIGKIAIDKTVGWALAVLTFIGSDIISLGALNSLSQFAGAVLLFYSVHKIYKSRSDNAVIMTVFSVLTFGFLIPIFLFAIRNNEVIK